MPTRAMPGWIILQESQLVEKVGAIYTPQQQSGDVKVGVVQSTGLVEDNGFSLHVAVGQRVYYRGAAAIPLPESGIVAIPIGALLGVADEGARRPAQQILALPEWSEVETKDFPRWSAYLNIRSFEFHARFLEPFRGIADLGKIVFEEAVAQLRKVDLTHGDPLLGKINQNEMKMEDGATYAVSVNDDFWDGILAISDRDRGIAFRKERTDFRALCATAPTWLRAFRGAISTDAFREVAGRDYSRIPIVAMRVKQQLRLAGQGIEKKNVRNSVLMGQFLHLGHHVGGPTSPLSALGFGTTDVRRLDLKLGFRKEIAGREYSIFLNVSAPANDEWRTLELDWEIQDRSPGDLRERDYTPWFLEFFRDTVLRTFYTRWFNDNDVTCTSER